jgi:hypothetical protein
MLLLPHLWDWIWKVAEKSWITVGYQIIPSCSGWGSHSTWNDSYIHSKIYKVIAKQFVVDGDMEPPPCCYHHTCGTGFRKSPAEIMDHCWVSNDTIMQWLRLSSHMEWFPHPFQTCKRWLTNIVYSWWGYGAPTMLLLPHLWDQIWKVGWKSMDHCWVPNNTIMQWLRLSSHMEWFLHPF